MVAMAAPNKLPPTQALHRQAEKLDRVVRELRKHAADQPAPHLVERAIAGLEAELAAVRRQLGRH